MINHKKYSKYVFFPLVSQFLSNFGDGILISVLTLAVANYTNSAGDLSAVLSMYSLPWLIFSLFAGSIIDRIGASKIALYANFTRACLLVLLGVLTFEFKLNLYILAIFSLIMGCLEVLFDNSFGVLLPKFVKPSELEQVNGISSTLEIVSNKFLGVNLGSFLISLTLVFSLFSNSIFYLFSAIILFISVNRENENKVSNGFDRKNIIQILKGDIFLGLKYLVKDRILVALVMVGVIWNICYGIEQIILILYVKQAQNNANVMYSLIISSSAFGGIVGGVLIGKLSKVLEKQKIVVLASILYFVSFLLKYTYYTRPLVLLGSFIAGGAEILLNAISVSYRQRKIPQDILGRVSTPIRLFIVGAVTVGNLAGGVLGSMLSYDLLGIALGIFFSISVVIILLLLNLKSKPK